MAGRQRFPSTASLQVLLAVAERGSTTAAAESIALSQSAVSKQLLGLEEMIGSPAFLRTPHGMVPTEIGRIYIDHARIAIKAMEDAILQAARLMPGPRLLRLQVPPIFGDRWLLPRFHSFSARHPDIEVQYTTFNASSQSEIPDGVFQFVSVASRDPRADYLFGADVRLVSAPSYFDKMGLPESLEDASRGIMLEHPQTPFHWRHFAEHHDCPDLTPRHTTRFGYYTMVIRAALAGQGMALIPFELLTDDLASGRLVNPAGLGYRSDYGYYFLAQENASQRHSMAAFRDWLLAERDAR